MDTELRPGETIVMEGRANMQRGRETVGGHLALTNHRLVFESHRLNIQDGTDEIARDDIVAVENAWTKFLGVVPLAPNSIVVTTRDGSTASFVVSGRAKWRDAIAPSPG